VVQKAYRERIVIVSPSLLLLSIQVIQQVLRDQRLREKAHEIQDEVAKMMLDVDRLDDRVKNLSRHFAAVGKDIEQILVSSEKVTRRATRSHDRDGDAEARAAASHAGSPDGEIAARPAAAVLRRLLLQGEEGERWLTAAMPQLRRSSSFT
jgi:DNA recombination protein RmuC